jgi:hypothetical protein
MSNFSQGYGWQDGKYVEIPSEEFCELSMKQLEQQEPSQRAILFGRMYMLNDNLRTLFELKGISDKFKRKRNATLHSTTDEIEEGSTTNTTLPSATDESEDEYEEGRITNTTLHSAMEEIEKNHNTFFECYHPTMSSKEMGEAALELIKDTRITYDIIVNYDDNTLGVEKMHETLYTFLYLVEIETEYLRKIS